MSAFRAHEGIVTHFSGSNPAYEERARAAAGCLRVERARTRGWEHQPPDTTCREGTVHTAHRSLPQPGLTGGPCPQPLRTSQLAPRHLQLLVVLVRKVEESSHVEEELGAILQQQQDEAQAAQAGRKDKCPSPPRVPWRAEARALHPRIGMPHLLPLASGGGPLHLEDSVLHPCL